MPSERWERWALSLVGAVLVLLVATEVALGATYSRHTNEDVNTATGNGAFTLAVRFIVAGDGYQLTAFRYYRPASETGTHTGRLYNAVTCELLVTESFTSETASGWQQQNLATAYALEDGQSYFATVGSNSVYATRTEAADGDVTVGPLTFKQRGRFHNTTGTCPDTVGTVSYMRDVLVTDGAPVEENPTLVALSAADRERLDLTWWGLWALIGLTLALMVAPMFHHSWRFWRD